MRSASMRTDHSNTPQHRARTLFTKLDRTRLPLRLLQSALFRARKPSIPRNTLHFMNDPAVRDGSDFLLTPPPPTPYPTIPDEPLVPPHAWNTLEAFTRPPMPEIDDSAIVALKPEYEGITAEHVRNSWSWCRYRALALYHKLEVETPKTNLPSEYNVIMHDAGLAACPTHVFAVYPYPDPADDGPAGVRRKVNALGGHRREVGLYPTYGLIWAANCTRLPRIPRPAPFPPSKLVRTKAAGKDAATVIRLPVVPLALPYPPMFLPLASFVNSRVPIHFLVGLLPTPSMLSMLTIPHITRVELHEQFECSVAMRLAGECDLRRLCCLARNVHGTYRNVVALGMVDDLLWETLFFTWAALRRAMDLAVNVVARNRANNLINGA